jgi:Domain of unknown function (DUF6456)
MQQAERAEVHFVRLLVKGAVGLSETEEERCSGFRIEWVGRSARLGADKAATMASQGILDIRNGRCTARAEAVGWLRRQLSGAGEFAEQHRQTQRLAGGITLNLAESPLARLAQVSGGRAFLDPHQLEAGERVRRLVERAQLMRRITTSYSDAPMASGGQAAADISDLAYDARRRLGRCLDALPADCAGVVLDVCGMFKGLQQIERERGWPRRSAKLVLRIGLDQLAREFGLSPQADGKRSSRSHVWLDEGARPDVFG